VFSVPAFLTSGSDLIFTFSATFFPSCFVLALVVFIHELGAFLWSGAGAA